MLGGKPFALAGYPESMSPTALQRRPISFEKEISVASTLFEAYLIISAVREQSAKRNFKFE